MHGCDLSLIRFQFRIGLSALDFTNSNKEPFQEQKTLSDAPQFIEI